MEEHVKVIQTKKKTTITINLYFPVSVQGYRRFALRDYPGYDMATFNNYNIYKCAEECDNNQGCAGYSFVFTNNICYIKHTAKASGKNFRHHTKDDLFIRKGGPSGKINYFHWFYYCYETTFFCRFFSRPSL